VQAEKGGQESFLHRIFRVESIEQSCRKGQRFGAVAVDEISKGGFLTGQNSPHDLLVIRDAHLPTYIVASRAKKVAPQAQRKILRVRAGRGFANRDLNPCAKTQVKSRNSSFMIGSQQGLISWS
jgi:hypothetical protein